MARRKMSKSLGNFVGINEPASEMFGKLMSISDDLMARYYDLLLGRTPPADVHPLEAKKQTRVRNCADVSLACCCSKNAR